MKRILTVLVSLLPLTAVAQVDYAMLVRNARQMDVSADIDLDQDLARGAKALALMPRIVGAQDTLNLKPVGVYLKDKHFQLLSGLGVASGDAVYGKQDLPATLHYKTSVPYQRWMDDSKLELVTLYEGCCGDGGIERVDSLAVYQRPPIRYAPEYINVAAPAQSKSRSVSGEASVVFASGSAKILSIFNTDKVVIGSSALVASSDNSTSGLFARALAIPTRCFCPPESSPG